MSVKRKQQQQKISGNSLKNGGNFFYFCNLCLVFAVAGAVIYFKSKFIVDSIEEQQKINHHKLLITSNN